MSELYWITTLGKINTFFWIGLGISIAVSLVCFVSLIESDCNEEEHIISKKILKLNAFIILILSCGCTLTPTTDEVNYPHLKEGACTRATLNRGVPIPVR